MMYFLMNVNVLFLGKGDSERTVYFDAKTKNTFNELFRKHVKMKILHYLSHLKTIQSFGNKWC